MACAIFYEIYYPAMCHLPPTLAVAYAKGWMDKPSEPVLLVDPAHQNCPYCDWKLRYSPERELYQCRVCGTWFKQDRGATGSANPAAGDRPIVLPTFTPPGQTSVSSTYTENARLKAEALALLKKETHVEKNFEIISAKELPRIKKILSYIGVPVEERDSDYERTPYVTGFVILLSILVVTQSTAFIENFSLQPGHLARAGGLNLISYPYATDSLLGLIFNLFFIGIFLAYIEEDLGPIVAGAIVLAGSIAAAFAHLAFNHSQFSLGGLTGVCYAIVTFYCLRNPKQKLIMVLPILGWFMFAKRVRLHASVFLILYIFFELIGLVFQNDQALTLSPFGNMGGVIAGAGFWYYFKQT